jgi:hypothetical protein
MTRPTAVVGTLFGVVLLWYLLQHAIDAVGERLGWWKRHDETDE